MVRQMIASRREFLVGASSVLLAGYPKDAYPATAVPTLRAVEGKVRLADPTDTPETTIWGYDGQVPGPTLRVRQGERLMRRFLNELPQSSSIHWHGIRIVNTMDGVAHLTQPPVPSQGEFLYDFVAPDAGTFWYHSHLRGWEQVARGLYGVLIVDEAQPPSVDREEILVIDDWRLTSEAQIDDSFDAIGEWAHGGRIGNWITVNNSGSYQLQVAQHERIRLRLLNAANARIFSLKLRGLDGWVVALDGQPLAVPMPIEPFRLAPAQRVDLIVDVMASPDSAASLISVESDAGYAIASFGVKGSARSKRLAMVEALASNPVAALPSLDDARALTLHMEGGAMGGMRVAMLDGREMDMRSLVQAGKVWALNSQAGMPDEPMASVAVGETVRMKMINDTAWPHAMHLHGHHFRRIDGRDEPGPLRDTLLVDRRETVEIAFVADNPGDWLFHCHMLEHSAGGMITWLRVH